MRQNSALTKFLRLLFAYFITISAILTPYQAHAVYSGTRTTTYSYVNNPDAAGYNPSSPSSGRCNTGAINFDVFTSNNDFDMVMDNPTCASFVALSGAAIIAADYGADALCSAPVSASVAAIVGAETPVAAGLPPATPFPQPTTLLRIANKITRCGTRAVNYSIQQSVCVLSAGATCAEAALAATDMGKCCAGMGVYLAAIAASVSALAIIWDQARITYENGRICGHDWQRWTQTGGKWKKVKGLYRECIEHLFNDNILPAYCGPTYGITTSDNNPSVSNKYYREFVYGGKEFEDKGEDNCNNPIDWNTSKRTTTLGYTTHPQRYYMTGPGAAPVFACHRFLTADPNDNSAKVSYECCKRRSQNAICIENLSGLGSALGSYDHMFCEIGTRCTISNITFEIYGSTAQSNYVCAKTYSVCPYNHLLGGGSEQKQYDTTDTSQVTNFCQFMNHCSKLPILPYVRTSSLEGDYISSACRDMKGDSQNVYGYTSELIPINTRGFSAPMIQCFKETMENVFLNKAGSTKCVNPDEVASPNGNCLSGTIYKKGEDLPGESFFIKIQNKIQDIIKIALTISIIMFGVAILFAVPNAHINKKTLLPYILKLGLVMYFAVGDGWQFGFMKGVLSASTYLADLTFKVDESGSNDKLDGCQFPRYNYADTDNTTKYNNPSYPPGKEYLRPWDTLDCKIARALGFGPEVSVPNLVMMVLGGFFTGGLGIVFFVASFVFAFFLISMTIRALHIFLMSITVVILLMYVSPITITLSLFNKTKEIFNKWWKEMLGFILQPMILFAYIGIMLTIFDKVIIGEDVTFTPSVVEGVTDTYGRRVPKRISCNSTANDTSIYCIFRIAEITTFDGFETLGIGIPMLASMNKTKLESIMKAAIIMFILTKFMDQITLFASKLVGGSELKSNWGSVAEMAGASYKALRGIQVRAMRLGQRVAGSVARKGVEGIKGIARDIGDGGKSIAAPSGGKPGADAAVFSNSGKAADSAVRSTPSGGGADSNGGADNAVRSTPSSGGGADNAVRSTPSGDGTDNAVKGGGGSTDSNGASSSSPPSTHSDVAVRSGGDNVADNAMRSNGSANENDNADNAIRRGGGEESPPAPPQAPTTANNSEDSGNKGTGDNGASGIAPADNNNPSGGEGGVKAESQTDSTVGGDNGSGSDSDNGSGSSSNGDESRGGTSGAGKTSDGENSQDRDPSSGGGNSGENTPPTSSASAASQGLQAPKATTNQGSKKAAPAAKNRVSVVDATTTSSRAKARKGHGQTTLEQGSGSGGGAYWNKPSNK